MIYTITFNPSLDYFEFFDEQLVEGKIIKAKSSYMRAGGKGINVSLSLAAVGIPSKAIAFLGGLIGDYIEKELAKNSDIEIMRINIDEENRIDVKLKNKVETAINGCGPMVTQRQQDELVAKLEQVSENDYILISGSFCQGIDSGIINRIADIANAKGAHIITDLTNLTLADYQAIKPFMIKPNKEELAMMFGEDVNTIDIIKKLDYLIENGVSNVLLSLGEQGAILANKEGKYLLCGPDIEVVSTVGCGDSMLANTLAAISNGSSVLEAAKFGEAAGRAKAQIDELPTQQQINGLYQKVIVKAI